jgi:putative PIN family toxin of toxin-antitoxin system
MRCATSSVPRAVLDPNVLVSALISRVGPSALILVALRDGPFELVTSPLVLRELSDVLGREKFRRYATQAEVEAYVLLVRTESVVIDDPEQGEPLGDDPDDKYLIALARAARVDALVSGDPHLLRLRDRIPVQTPREFLEAIGER